MFKKLPYTISLCLLLAYAFTLSVSAQGQSITIQPVTGFTSLTDAAATLTRLAIMGGGIACFAYLVYGAFKYITAGDKSENAAGARTTMINAIIGLIILSLVYVIWFILISVIGLGDSFGTSSAPVNNNPPAIPGAGVCPNGQQYC